MAFFCYLVASQRNGSLYAGSTDNLYVRTLQHRAGRFDGHTKKHSIARLVWFEAHPTRDAAFKRERQIKEWKRIWKLELIEKTNPGWRDLFENLQAERGTPAAEWSPPDEL